MRAQHWALLSTRDESSCSGPQSGGADQGMGQRAMAGARVPVVLLFAFVLAANVLEIEGAARTEARCRARLPEMAIPLSAVAFRTLRAPVRSPDTPIVSRLHGDAGVANCCEHCNFHRRRHVHVWLWQQPKRRDWSHQVRSVGVGRKARPNCRCWPLD